MKKLRKKQTRTKIENIKQINLTPDIQVNSNNIV